MSNIFDKKDKKNISVEIYPDFDKKGRAESRHRIDKRNCKLRDGAARSDAATKHSTRDVDKIGSRLFPNLPSPQTEKAKGLTLNLAKIGKSYKILRCRLPTEKKLRFFEMGLTPNSKARIKNVAPLGDPLEIEVRGYSLCVRTDDAAFFDALEVAPDENNFD